MPNKPLRPCAYCGCGEFVVSGYCMKHKPKERYRGNAAQRGYNYRWQLYREKFLKANPLCVECLKNGQVEPATVADHIIDHKGNQELFWDVNNHQALCRSCHSRKTARTNPYKGGR